MKKITIILFCFGYFALGVWVQMTISDSDEPINEQIRECYIPSPDTVNRFCKVYKYESGWVSQNCDKNEIMCYREKGNAKYYDCLNIKEKVNE